MTMPLKTWLKDAILRTEIGYRSYLKYKWGVDKPLGYPEAPWRNAVLRNRQAWENAIREVKALGLPPHPEPTKNWDHIAALDCILERTDHTAAHILDAGAELYSMILPWLSLYGYRNLIGINLAFERPVRRGVIHYEHGDITKTRFKANTFDAIACLSVIEHGVNLQAYFRETARILKPNGVLITSTDYWVHQIDTKDQVAYGAPVHIFSKDEILSTLNIARGFGLELLDEIDLECQDKPIRWEQFGLSYTFLIFALWKKDI